MKKKPAALPETGCHTCRYWKETTEAEDQERNGQCRRSRPYVLHDGEEGPYTMWPYTTADDWCGDHQPTQH